jgi:hypothetical protein
MGILDTIMRWVMAARTDASLPNMRVGGAQVDEGQNALMVSTVLSFFSVACLTDCAPQIQFFEWESSAPKGITWWKHFENEVPRLKELGVTQVWLPRKLFCLYSLTFD